MKSDNFLELKKLEKVLGLLSDQRVKRKKMNGKEFVCLLEEQTSNELSLPIQCMQMNIHISFLHEIIQLFTP